MIVMPVPQAPSVVVMTRMPPGRAAWVRRTSLPWGLATLLSALVITAGPVMWAASSVESPVGLFVGVLVWACSAMPVALTGIGMLGARAYIHRDGLVNLTLLRQCRRMTSGMALITWLLAPVAFLLVLLPAQDSPWRLLWALLPASGLVFTGCCFFAGRTCFQDPHPAPYWTEPT